MDRPPATALASMALTEAEFADAAEPRNDISRQGIVGNGLLQSGNFIG